MRPPAVCGLIVLAVLLGAAACGGSKKARPNPAEQARIANNWRVGLTRWHGEMLVALDGISLLFSTTKSLATLARNDTKASAALAGFERTLLGCTPTVKGLRPLPEGFGDARRFALLACKNLELGEQKIENAVARMRRGLGVDLSLATEPLSNGQSEMDVAISAMPPAST